MCFCVFWTTLCLLCVSSEIGGTYKHPSRVYLCKEAMRRYLCVCVFYSSTSFTHTQTSNHGADGVEVGVKADHFPLGGLCVCVVHGVLESGLAVVVLVDGASRVLRFICFSWGGKRRKERLSIRSYPNYPAQSLSPAPTVSIILLWTAAVGK